MKIGRKIRNAREDKDLTQVQIAQQIPMNQSSYSKIERDLLEPSIEQLRQICTILNLDANNLLEIKNNENKDILFAERVKRDYKEIYEEK